MPIREHHSDVVRIVQCLQGKVSVRMELCIRFDFGRTVPWTGLTTGLRTGPREGNAWAAAAGPGVVYLRSQEHPRTEHSTAIADFTLGQGQRRSFVLTYAAAQEPPPRRINVSKAFGQTEAFWRQWCGLSTYSGPWQDAIERSLITLKALTYRPTGGIVAAATTSLPERLGIDRNWDYRYCWLRDAAFTLESLLSVGYHSEAIAWQQWLLQSLGSDVRGLQIMYGVHGERHLPECELPWLRGYKGSGPVRIGNTAAEQFQLDVFGEVADALARMVLARIPIDPRLHPLQKDLAEYVASVHHRPSSGIWERRDREGHYTYSKMMVWLTLDQGIKSFAKSGTSTIVAGWKRRRESLHRQICSRGFNRRLGSFVQSFGSSKLDASVLLLPVFGFLPFHDERVKSTLDAIQRKLVCDGLVNRYLPEKRQERESAFLACSFWLVQNTGRGRPGEPRRTRLLGKKSSGCVTTLRLLSEEYNLQHNQFGGKSSPGAFPHCFNQCGKGIVIGCMITRRLEP